MPRIRTNGGDTLKGQNVTNQLARARVCVTALHNFGDIFY